MHPIKPPAKRTHVVLASLSIFALLAITVMLQSSCDRPGGPPGKATATPTPTPTATPEKQILDGDTPIIVKGGGSIDLDFNPAAFYGNPPACANCRITKVELEQIKDAGQPHTTPVLTPCTLPAQPTIKILTKQNRDDITVRTSGTGVSIEYSETQYPGIVSECGDPKKHHSKDGEIEGVSINNVPCGGCTKWKRCKVWIHVF
jgi:hypothetical protein